MAAYDMLKNILKAHNARVLEEIAATYELDESELKAKYLRPTFYLPDVADAPAVITYKELKTTRKKKCNVGGESVSPTTEKDSE